MACTGTLPPNARLGQSFVHDPKVGNLWDDLGEGGVQIAKEREVKAQIMVRFCNVAGDHFVVIRSFQVRQLSVFLDELGFWCSCARRCQTCNSKQSIRP